MLQTALAEAFKKAGGDPSAALLHGIAIDVLRKHERDPRKAVGSFTDEVRDSGGILIALMGDKLSYAIVRDAGLEYLERVAADMFGPKSSGGFRVGLGADSVQFRNDASGKSVSPNGDGSVRSRSDGLQPLGAPEKSEGDGVRGARECQAQPGPSSSPANGNGAVRRAHDSQLTGGRVVPIHNKPRGLSATQTMLAVSGPSLFETLLVRARPIGDFAFGELDTIISTSKRETALLTMIRDHAQVQPPTMKVRDVIKLEDLQRMAQKAAEMSDAG